MSLIELFDYFSLYHFCLWFRLKHSHGTLVFITSKHSSFFKKESLDGNPALFCKKQPPVVDVANQYLELCKLHPTPIPNVKHRLNGFCGY